MNEHVMTESGKRCKSAAASIMELLKFQCQGFILPPAEVKNLLGLAKDDMAWHLNEGIGQLKKELARRFVAMEVNPILGITVQLYRVPLQSYVLCSPRSLGNKKSCHYPGGDIRTQTHGQELCEHLRYKHRQHIQALSASCEKAHAGRAGVGGPWKEQNSNQIPSALDILQVFRYIRALFIVLRSSMYGYISSKKGRGGQAVGPCGRG